MILRLEDANTFMTQQNIDNILDRHDCIYWSW